MLRAGPVVTKCAISHVTNMLELSYMGLELSHMRLELSYMGQMYKSSMAPLFVIKQINQN